MIFEHTKYHPLARPKDKPWRELVRVHFKAEHGVDILDYDRLLYYMPEDAKTHQFVEVVGRLGVSLSAPAE